MADSNTVATIGAAAIGAIALIVNASRALKQTRNEAREKADEANRQQNGISRAAESEARRDLLSAQLAFAESLRIDRVDFVTQIKELRAALKFSEERVTDIRIDLAQKISALDDATKQVNICHEMCDRLEVLVESLRAEVKQLREVRFQGG